MQSLAAAEEKRGWQGVAEACLMGWHLCSLDAPTVAVVWAIPLARLGGVRPHAAEFVVLGLGTWIVYVLDRVLDGAGGRQSPRDGERLRARHHFHHKNRRLLLWLCCLAAAMLAVLCLQLPSQLVRVYLLLGVPVVIYGLRVHRRLLWPMRFERKTARVGRRKEAAVAVLFAAAVAAPAFVATPALRRPALLAATLLLALLCWLNCALISHAESAGLPSSAYTEERQQLATAALALAGVAAGVSLWEVGWLRAELRGSFPNAALSWLPAGAWNPAAAVTLSCLLLLTLLAGGRDLRAEARRVRVLADLGLLTPLLFLLARLR